MDVDKPNVDRDKTTPFLIRTFVKIGSFHRLTMFQDGTLPTTDEHQIFTWKNATLRQVLTTLRNVAPHVPEYRHPLARYSFRTVYADPTNKGEYAQKDLGMVYSRDILGEPGTVQKLLEEDEAPGHQGSDGDTAMNGSGSGEKTEHERQERTLDELRFVPGDYLCIAVILPKSVSLGTEQPSRSSAGWKNAGPGGKGGDAGWAGSLGTGSGGPGSGRGGGHWRGGSDGPPSGPGGRGRGGGRGGCRDGDRERDRDRDGPRDRDRDRDADRDRRVPPPRRGSPGRRSPPPPRGGGWGRGGGGRDRRSRSRSFSRSRSRTRSRSPPPHRRRR